MPQHEPRDAHGASRGDRTLCGWRVRSEVELGELLPWSGDDRPPELTVCVGPVPERLDDVRFTGRRLQVGHDGTCRYHRPALGTLLIRDGREVVVEPHDGVAVARLAGVLLGPVLGILCHQRGLIPLHACCVEMDGAAVAFTGPRGAGKSTVAATFMRAGHGVLADDVTVVDLSDPRTPMALPGIPRLKLSGDVLDALGIERGGLERNHLRPAKFHVPVRGMLRSTPLPLSAICHLHDATDEEEAGPDRLRGGAAIADLMASVYAPRVARRVVGRRALFLRVARMATAVGATYRLRRRREGPAAGDVVGQVTSLVRGPPGGGTGGGDGASAAGLHGLASGA